MTPARSSTRTLFGAWPAPTSKGSAALSSWRNSRRASRTRPIASAPRLGRFRKSCAAKPFSSTLPRPTPSTANIGCSLRSSARLRCRGRLPVCRDPDARRDLLRDGDGRGRSQADGSLPGFPFSRARRRMYGQLVDTLPFPQRRSGHRGPQATSASRQAITSSARSRADAPASRDSQTDDIREMERLIAYLPASLPEQSRATSVAAMRRLSHRQCDVRRSRRLTAVLDWELATLGDPVADFPLLRCSG